MKEHMYHVFSALWDVIPSVNVCVYMCVCVCVCVCVCGVCVCVSVCVCVCVFQRSDISARGPRWCVERGKRKVWCEGAVLDNTTSQIYPNPLSFWRAFTKNYSLIPWSVIARSGDGAPAKYKRRQDLPEMVFESRAVFLSPVHSK